MLFLKLNSIMNILIVHLTIIIAYTCNGKILQDIELLFKNMETLTRYYESQEGILGFSKILQMLIKNGNPFLIICSLEFDNLFSRIAVAMIPVVY